MEATMKRFGLVFLMVLGCGTTEPLGVDAELEVDAAIGEPDAGSDQPDSELEAPDALDQSDGTLGQPDSALGQPDSALGQPDSVLGQPDSALGQPDSALGQPDAYLSEPDAAHGQPDAAPSQPDATMPTPDATSSQPDATTACAEDVPCDCDPTSAAPPECPPGDNCYYSAGNTVCTFWYGTGGPGVPCVNDMGCAPGHVCIVVGPSNAQCFRRCHFDNPGYLDPTACGAAYPTCHYNGDARYGICHWY
jgi:hypothetical protein